MPAGYKIRGIAPYELRNYPDPVKLQFWGWVVDLGIKAKDRDLSQGLDASGEPLRPIAPKTRKYRRSEMTPTGKGDPSAPPLMPGRELSRTRSLLAGRAFTTHAEFYWRFDPYSGDTWARILTIHKRKGRDVFGLSEEATDLVKRQALAKWMKWKKAGGVVPMALEGRRVLGPEYHEAPAAIETVGRTSLQYATHGINTPELSTLTPGRHQGGLTESELRAYLRGTAPANVQSRAGSAYNRILSHIWGHPGQPTTGGGAVVPLTPTPKPKAPEKPIPAPIPPPIAIPEPKAVPSLDIISGPRQWTLESAKAYALRTRAASEQSKSYGDRWHEAIKTEAGFDGLPEILPSKQFKEATSGLTKMWRGEGSAKFYQQFRTGKLYPGTGIYGNGTYTADSRAAAAHYAKGQLYSLVHNMALKAEAKVIEAKTLWIMAGKAKNHLRSLPQTDGIPELIELINDPGRFATMLGYDAISVKTSGFHVIQNRTALILEGKP